MKFIALCMLALALALNSNAHSVHSDLRAMSETFASLSKTDKASTQHHEIALGQLIKTNATNFLLALKANEKTIPSLKAVVTSFGPNFEGHPDDAKIEAQLRIKALEKAKQESGDKEVKRLADECIGHLKKL